MCQRVPQGIPHEDSLGPLAFTRWLLIHSHLSDSSQSLQSFLVWALVIHIDIVDRCVCAICKNIHTHPASGAQTHNNKNNNHCVRMQACARHMHFIEFIQCSKSVLVRCSMRPSSVRGASIPMDHSGGGLDARGPGAAWGQFCSPPQGMVRRRTARHGAAESKSKSIPPCIESSRSRLDSESL